MGHDRPGYEKRSFTGTDGTPGFIYAWDGNKEAGEGAQEIKSVNENERVDIEVRFIRPFQNTAQAFMITEDAGNQTRVTWV